MCGILFRECSCCTNLTEIKNRGPDYCGEIHVNNIGVFIACVLHQQGLDIVRQPMESENLIFLWNGENYADIDSTTNDGLNLLHRMNSNSEMDILSSICKCIGPYAFVIFNKERNALYFGRDCLGRRSLLAGLDGNGRFCIISSVVVTGCSHVKKWIELPPVGIFKYFIHDESLFDVTLYKYDFHSSSNSLYGIATQISETILPTNIKLINISQNPSTNVEILLKLLYESVRRRLKLGLNKCQNCYKQNKSNIICNHAKMAVLFSGGVDSAVLAAIADKFVPESDPIDLLNVSFETNKTYNTSPDRISGLNCLNELRIINPSRQWNFVEIDVSADELRQERQTQIASLIQPSDTVLDDSIGCALWFAARGKGRLLDGCHFEYQCPARIVLTGIGADELMAGYCRHRNTFSRLGYDGLTAELNMELHRIGSRNMGRDDRVISSHGREGRFPFLDENVVSFLLSLPITERCDLSKEKGVGEKMLLRVLAKDYLNLTTTWNNEKRAIQFGSRIAKIDKLLKGGNASQKCDKLNVLCE